MAKYTPNTDFKYKQKPFPLIIATEKSVLVFIHFSVQVLPPDSLLLQGLSAATYHPHFPLAQIKRSTSLQANPPTSVCSVPMTLNGLPCSWGYNC